MGAHDHLPEGTPRPVRPVRPMRLAATARCLHEFPCVPACNVRQRAIVWVARPMIGHTLPSAPISRELRGRVYWRRSERRLKRLECEKAPACQLSHRRVKEGVGPAAGQQVAQKGLGAR